MSGDEVAVLIFSLVFAGATWGYWYVGLLAPKDLRPRGNARTWLVLAPPACIIVLGAVLGSAASFDVRDSPVYILFYLVLGAAWVRFMFLFVPLTGGISVRDDVAERGNPAAAVATSGSLLALTLTFAGANIGDGPGWWVVVFCAALSSISLLALWWIVQRVTQSADAITIDRDMGTAWRTALLLVACGLVLGRAVAGNWISAGDTVVDFVAGAWPAVLFAGIDSWMGLSSQPSRDMPSSPLLRDGLAPGFMYLTGACVWLIARGSW